MDAVLNSEQVFGNEVFIFIVDKDQELEASIQRFKETAMTKKIRSPANSGKGNCQPGTY